MADWLSLGVWYPTVKDRFEFCVAMSFVMSQKKPPGTPYREAAQASS